VIVARRAAVLVSVLALLVTPLVVAAPASAAADVTGFFIEGTPQNLLVGATPVTVGVADATFTASGDGTIASIDVVPPTGHDWFLTLHNDIGVPLAAGTYVDLPDYFTASATAPSASLSGVTQCGYAGRTTVRIDEIVVDPGTSTITAFAAEFDSACHLGESAHGWVRYHSSIPAPATTTTTLVAPTTVVPGATVHATGTVATTSGPASGSVRIERHEGLVTTVLPPVALGAGGSYAFDDVAGTAPVVYKAVYLGADGLGLSSSTASVDVQKSVSVVALTVPASGTRAKAYAVSGRLTSGGAPVVGAVVTLARKDLSGTASFPLTTDATGAFHRTDAATVGGTVTWTASWAGDTTRSAATASKAIALSRLATAMTIVANAKVYSLGAKATVTVHLGTTYNGRTVSVYAMPANDWQSKPPGTLLVTGRVSSAGTIVASYPMRTGTTFTAVFAGDYRYAAARRSVAPVVRSSISVVLGGFARMSGSTYVYTVQNPLFSITVRPKWYGLCTYTTVQRYVGGTWKVVVAPSCAQATFSSTLALTLSVTHTKGARYRVRTYVNATKFATAGTSVWRTFTFA
jgi:hypothetical protein